MQKTYQPKGKKVKRNEVVIDAKGQVLGRLSTQIAIYLMGKNKPSFSAHIDSGDIVKVINAEKVILTGKKAQTKVYRGHSGYPGGFKESSFQKLLTEHPERIIEHAVSGMLPDNKLKSERMKRLTIFTGDKNA